jgi:hypothetical protein
MLVGVAYSVFARTRTPDRVFGMLLVVQYGSAGSASWCCRARALYGHGVLFGAHRIQPRDARDAAVLDDYPAAASCGRAGGGIRYGLLAAAVGSVFLFQAGNMGLAAYMLELARHFGIDAEVCEHGARAATWIGIAGAGLVVVFGTRFGHLAARRERRGHDPRHVRLPLGRVEAVYLAANCVTAITWSFAIAYLLGSAPHSIPQARRRLEGSCRRWGSPRGRSSPPGCSTCRLHAAHQYFRARARRERAGDVPARPRPRPPLKGRTLHIREGVRPFSG